MLENATLYHLRVECGCLHNPKTSDARPWPTTTVFLVDSLSNTNTRVLAHIVAVAQSIPNDKTSRTIPQKCSSSGWVGYSTVFLVKSHWTDQVADTPSCRTPHQCYRHPLRRPLSRTQYVWSDPMPLATLYALLRAHWPCQSTWDIHMLTMDSWLDSICGPWFPWPA
jgi:hypothetical protein